MAGGAFLDLPSRSTKPRSTGLTHVLDKGMLLADMQAFLSERASLIDLWKLGWGTSYLDPDPSAKVHALRSSGVLPCVGGTLLEIAWAQGKVRSCLSWASDLGFPCVEVSNGAVGMSVAEKRRLIAESSKRFVVLSEVGSKDPSAPVSPGSWAEEMAGDLEAGASLVLAEGRESGTVGLYRSDGKVRQDVVEAVFARVGTDEVIFEAPRKDQQAFFVNRFGPEVNLGNVAPEGVLSLEALRLGLRADTIALLRGRREAAS